MKKISIEDIHSRLDTLAKGEFAYLDRTSGKISSVSKKALMKAEGEPYDGPVMDEPTQEEIAASKRILDNCDDEYIPLPTYTELNFPGMMKNFALQQENPEERKALMAAAKGKDIKLFNTELEKRSRAEDWKEYRTSEIRVIAEEWCEKHKLEFE